MRREIRSLAVTGSAAAVMAAGWLAMPAPAAADQTGTRTEVRSTDTGRVEDTASKGAGVRDAGAPVRHLRTTARHVIRPASRPAATGKGAGGDIAGRDTAGSDAKAHAKEVPERARPAAEDVRPVRETSGHGTTGKLAVTRGDDDRGKRRVRHARAGWRVSGLKPKTSRPLPRSLRHRQPAPADDLDLTQTADVGLSRPGGKVKLTVQMKNNGSSEIKGAKVSDDLADILDKAVYAGDAVSDIGKVRFDKKAGKLYWTGDIPANGTAKVTFSVKTKRNHGGDNLLKGILKREDTPPPARVAIVPSSRKMLTQPVGDDELTTEVGVMDIKVRHTADKKRVKPGKNVNYVVEISAQPPYPALETKLAVRLAKMLDDAKLLKNVRTDKGKVHREGNNLVWTGDLPKDGRATITFVAKTKTGGDGTLITTASDNYYYCKYEGAKNCRTKVIMLKDKATGTKIPIKVRPARPAPVHIAHAAHTAPSRPALPTTGTRIAPLAGLSALLLGGGALLLIGARLRPSLSDRRIRR